MDWGTSPKPDDHLPPYSLELEVIEAIESAIRLAMKRVTPNINGGSAKEIDLNRKLKNELRKILKERVIPEFNRDRLDPPVLGEEHNTPEKESSELRPDLTIVVHVDQVLPHDGFHAYFIECKIISNTSSVTAYVEELGLHQYPDCEYAWATTSAGMVGYVRPDATCTNPEPSLKEYFSKSGYSEKRRKRLKLFSGPQSAKKGSDVVETVHNRSCELPDEEWKGTGVEAGPITVRHLWVYLG